MNSRLQLLFGSFGFVTSINFISAGHIAKVMNLEGSIAAIKCLVVEFQYNLTSGGVDKVTAMDGMESKMRVDRDCSQMTYLGITRNDIEQGGAVSMPFH